jgi:hypothetical protein
MSSYGYAVEQIGSAVHLLATGNDNLRSRLKEAIPFIVFAPPGDLPGETAERLRALQNEIQELVMSGTSEELLRFADRLVALDHRMQREEKQLGFSA